MEVIQEPVDLDSAELTEEVVCDRSDGMGGCGNWEDFECTADGWVSLRAAPTPLVDNYGRHVSALAPLEGEQSGTFPRCWMHVGSGASMLLAPTVRPRPVELPTGGVLADEMGIGKTLQIIALVQLTSHERRRAAVLKQDQPSSLPVREPTTDIDPLHLDAVVANVDMAGMDDEEEDGGGYGIDDPFVGLNLPCDSTSESGEKYMHTRKAGAGYETGPAVGPTAAAMQGQGQGQLLLGPTVPAVFVPETADAPCFCGRAEEYQSDRGWVFCVTCERWRHVACAGFESAAHAEEAEDYTCFLCRCSKLCLASNRDELVPGGTLVVVPNTLIPQWLEQFDTHTDGRLRVFVYHGIRLIQEATAIPHKEQRRRPSCKCARCWGGGDLHSIHPDSLGTYDVVLTSFETIKSELHQTESPFVQAGATRSAEPVMRRRKLCDATDNVDMNAPRQFRSRKVYEVCPSPLVCVDWHRLVLDEAQEVEARKSNQALMASRLTARHRWCVSGTPLGNGKLEDLQALGNFLRLEPLREEEDWKQLVGRPVAEGRRIGYFRLLALFAPLVMRRTQASVSAELGLPEQSEVVRWLRFSGVEQHMYAGLRKTSQEAYGLAQRHRRRDTLKAEAGLGEILLTLRKACCHPRLAAAKGGWRKVRTMSEVCLKMIEESRRGCEDKQRTYIFWLTSVAGLFLLHADAAARTGRGDGRYEGRSEREHLWKAWDTLDKACVAYEDNREVVPLTLLADVRPDGAAASLPLLMGVREEVYCGRTLLMAWSGRTDLGARTDPALWEWPDAAEVPSSMPSSSSSSPVLSSSEVLCPRAISSRIDFAAGHRLLEARVSMNVREYIAAAQHMLRRQTYGDSDSDSDSDHHQHQHQHQRISSVIVCFPKRVAIQAVLNSDGFYSDIASLDVPNPLAATAAHTTLLRPVPEVCFTNFGHSGRCRSWRIRVDSLHSLGMDVSLASAVPTPTPVPAAAAAGWGQGHGACNNVPTVVLGIQLLGASFDVDVFQEIHSKQKMCEVYRRLRAMGAVQQGEVVAGTRLLLNAEAEAETGAGWKVMDGCASGSAGGQSLPGAFESPPDTDAEDEFAATCTLMGDADKGDADRDTGTGTEAVGAARGDGLVSPEASRASFESPEARNSSPRIRMFTPVSNNEYNDDDDDDDRDRVQSHAIGGGRRLPPSSVYTALCERVTHLQSQEVMEATARQMSARVRVRDAAPDVLRDADSAWWVMLCRAMGGFMAPAGEVREPRLGPKGLSREDVVGMLMHDLEGVISSNEDAYVEALGSVRDVNGIYFKMDKLSKDLESVRLQCSQDLVNLPDDPSAALVAETGDCQRCCAGHGKTGPVCRHCRRHEVLEKYEQTMIYAYKRKDRMQRQVQVSVNAVGLPGEVSGGSSSSGGGDAKRPGEDAEMESYLRNKYSVEGPLFMLVRLLRNFVHNPKTYAWLERVFPKDNACGLTAAQLVECANDSVVRVDATRDEFYALGALHKRHQELLYLRDEVAQVAMSLRLVTQAEWDLTPEHVRGGMILDYRLGAELVTSDVKAAAAWAELREKKSELTFRKHLEAESRADRQRRRQRALLMAVERARAVPVGDRGHDGDGRAEKGNGEEEEEEEEEEAVAAVLTAPGEEEDICSICLELLHEGQAMLPCGHCCFHHECVRVWLKKSPCCPHCKKAASVNGIAVFDPAPAVPAPASPTKASRRVAATSTSATAAVVAAAAAAAAAGGANNAAAVGVVSTEAVRGDWGTKVNTLVADILAIRKRGGDKSVVFSNWVDMLHVVRTALEANKIDMELCVSSKDFRADGPMGRFKRNHNTSVLLLLMAKGAQGLTLTEANHVFLLHPIMNPQQEAQAVNRVRRIGQTKPTFVHRYLVVDSVEVSIHERQQRGIQEAGGVSALLAGAKKQKAGDQHQLTLEDFGSFFHDHDHVKESAQERDHAQHG
jgi:SNF2 family DNA or RNA helicase